MNHEGMNIVHLVILAALAQYLWFSNQVSKMRGKHGVKAPAISGHPEFERAFRVHQNTLEALVVLVPALMICAHEYDARLAAGCGLLFIVGREVYRREYMADPRTRTLGYALCAAGIIVAMLGGAWGALRGYF
jgi:glutathione S-transferase